MLDVDDIFNFPRVLQPQNCTLCVVKPSQSDQLLSMSLLRGMYSTDGFVKHLYILWSRYLTVCEWSYLWIVYMYFENIESSLEEIHSFGGHGTCYIMRTQMPKPPMCPWCCMLWHTLNY